MRGVVCGVKTAPNIAASRTKNAKSSVKKSQRSGACSASRRDGTLVTYACLESYKSSTFIISGKLPAMHIGELSRHTGVPIQTLRFYEREQLLREPPRTPGGYRSYGESDLACVRFIREAQELGFTLREISELLKIHEPKGSHPAHANGRGDWPKAFRIARERLAIIDKKIEKLQAFRDRLASGLRNSQRKANKVCPASAQAKRKCPALKGA
jgi:MerR family copper efflux transcriptional regulator